jgi:hypothetical protein
MFIPWQVISQIEDSGDTGASSGSIGPEPLVDQVELSNIKYKLEQLRNMSSKMEELC